MLQNLIHQVRHNCQLSSGVQAGLFSLCGLLLRLRQLYKWEHDLLPWQEPDSAPVLDWIEAQETSWDAAEGALWEALPLEKIGIPVLNRLLIDERCMISDVSHRILDLAWEDYRVNVLGHEARGSTGRGITPAYADEVGQFQIHYSEFLGAKADYAVRLSARLNRAASIVRESFLVVCSRAKHRQPILTH